MSNMVCNVLTNTQVSVVLGGGSARITLNPALYVGYLLKCYYNSDLINGIFIFDVTKGMYLCKQNYPVRNVSCFLIKL